MTENRVSELPTLDSVEQALDHYIDLIRGKATSVPVLEALELLVKLRLDLLIATRSLGLETRERVKFLFLRMNLLDSYIGDVRAVQLYRDLGRFQPSEGLE